MAIDYGYDLSCYDDCDIFFTEINGLDNTEIIAQSIYRRIITEHGTLIDDEDYGYGLDSLLSRGITGDNLQIIPSEIKQEILKDDRVDECTVEIIALSSRNIQLTINCIASDDTSFNLIINVTDFGATLTSFNS